MDDSGYKDRHLEIDNLDNVPVILCAYCEGEVPIRWKLRFSRHYYLTCECGITYRKVNEWVEAEHPYKKHKEQNG